MEIFALSLRTCGREYFFNVLPDSSFNDNDLYQVKLLAEEVPHSSFVVVVGVVVVVIVIVIVIVIATTTTTQNPSKELHERWIEMDAFLATAAGFSKYYQVLPPQPLASLPQHTSTLQHFNAKSFRLGRESLIPQPPLSRHNCTQDRHRFRLRNY